MYWLIIFYRLLTGLTKGFSTGYFGTVTCEARWNADIVKQYLAQTQQKIQTEIELGRIKGPFQEKPFANMHISPISMRPESDGTVRLLHNLSFLYDTSSVNNCIPKSETYVTYTTVTDTIVVIQRLGQGCFLAKSDIKAAFCLLPIRPEEHPLLGFQFQGGYYYDTCMAMGCSSSCKTWNICNSFAMGIVTKVWSSRTSAHDWQLPTACENQKKVWK